MTAIIEGNYGTRAGIVEGCCFSFNFFLGFASFPSTDQAVLFIK